MDYTVKSTKMYRRYAAAGNNADKLTATIKPLLDDTVKEHSDLFCNPEAEAYVGKLVDDYREVIWNENQADCGH